MNRYPSANNPNYGQQVAGNAPRQYIPYAAAYTPRAYTPRAPPPSPYGQQQAPRQQRSPAGPPKIFDLINKVNIPPPKAVETNPNCICERKVDYVLCNGCGYMDESGKVRVLRPCPIHPKRIAYSDLEKCPICKSKNEFTEYLQPSAHSSSMDTTN